MLRELYARTARHGAAGGSVNDNIRGPRQQPAGCLYEGTGSTYGAHRCSRVDPVAAYAE